MLISSDTISHFLISSDLPPLSPSEALYVTMYTNHTLTNNKKTQLPKTKTQCNNQHVTFPVGVLLTFHNLLTTHVPRSPCFHYSCFFLHLKVKLRLDFKMTQLIAFYVIFCPTSNEDANVWPKGNETISCDVIKSSCALW